MKGFVKRALCVGMSMTLLTTMAACGKKEQNNGVDKDYAKQYVYSGQTIDLGLSEDYSVSDVRYIGDRCYFLVDEYDYDTWEQTYKIVSVNKDYTDVQSVELPNQYSESFTVEINENDTEQEDSEESDLGDDTDDVNAGMLKKALIEKPIVIDEEAVEEDDSFDEELEDEETDDEENADDEVVDDDIEITFDEDDEYIDVDWEEDDWEEDDWDDSDYEYGDAYEYSNYNQGIISQNGKIYAVRYSTREDYSDPDNYIYEEKYFLDCWNLDGTACWEVEIPEVNQNGDYFYVLKMLPIADGKVIILGSVANTLVKIEADENGSLSPAKNIDTSSITAEYFSSCVVKEEGKVLLQYYGDMNMDKVYVVELDAVKETISPATELPVSVANNAYSIFGGNTADFLFTAGGEGIFSYKIGDTEAKKMMDFINSDINIGNINFIYEIDDRSFIGLYTDAYEWKNIAAVFTKVDPKDIKDKEVIAIGGSGISYNMELKKRAVDFNKSNDKYRIVMKDYSINDNTEDGSGTYTQLNNDIISGNMPEILVLTDGLPVESYISKGLLADIDELIAKDEELSKVEFVDNVFESHRVNGKLYEIIPSFVIRTYIAKASLVGDKTGWSLQDVNALEPTFPDGLRLFSEDMTRSSFIYEVMEYCGNDLVNLENGKCNFDSDEFAQLLEMAKQFPEEISDEFYEEDYWMASQSQYRDNRTLLKEMYISSMRWVKEDINGYMGEPVSYVGFPNQSKTGSIVNANDTYAISAKSGNKEGAWEFMRYYLTEEYQKSEDFWGLSVHKSILEESKKQAMEKSYYTDEEGNRIEYDDTMYINGQEITYSPLSQEQADQLVDFIYSVNNKVFHNEDIVNIVTEEAEAFFKGQKSAKEVTDLIQNRVQLYINENR